MKKLIPAIVLLLISAMIMATASYAWFSMNKTVTATGMEVKATTAISLLINDAASAPYANSVTADESFGSNVLKPASTTAALLGTATTFKFNATKDNQMFGSNGEGGVAKNDSKWMATGTTTPLSDSASGYWAKYTFNVKSAGNADDPVLNVYFDTLTITQKAEYTAHTKEAGTNVSDIPEGVYSNNTGNPFENAAAYNAATTYYTMNSADLTSAARVAFYVDGELFGIYDKAGTEATKKGVGATFVDDGTLTDPDLDPETSEAAAAEDVAISALGDTTTFEVGVDAVELVMLVWIEGEDAATVNANAGAAFTIEFALSIKD